MNHQSELHKNSSVCTHNVSSVSGMRLKTKSGDSLSNGEPTIWRVNFNNNFSFNFSNFRLQSVKVYKIQAVGQWRRKTLNVSLDAEVLSYLGDTCVIQKVPVPQMCHTEDCCPVRWHMLYTEGLSDTDVSHRRVLSCPGDTCVIQRS